MATSTFFDTYGIVFSNDDLVFDMPPMSPSAGLDEIRQYVQWLDQWRRIREQMAAGGVLAKMVTFRDLVKFGLLDLAAEFKKPPVPSGDGRAPIRLACSDLTSDLEPNAFAAYFRATTLTLAGVRASLAQASVSGVVTVGIKVNGVALLSTNLTIDANEKTSKTALVPVVLASTTLGDDVEVVVEIINAGSSARGLEVMLF